MTSVFSRVYRTLEAGLFSGTTIPAGRLVMFGAVFKSKRGYLLNCNTNFHWFYILVPMCIPDILTVRLLGPTSVLPS